MTSTPRFPTSNVRSKRGRCSIRGSPVHRIFRAGLLPTGRGKLKLLGKPCTSRSRWVLICGTDQTGKVIAQNDRLNHLIILRGETAMAAATVSVERAAAGARNRAALDFLKKPKRLLIGGKWVAAKSGKTFETVNPANEEVLALIAEGDKADVDEAVKAARKASDEGRWPSMGPHERARLMFKIAELIDAHADELAELETLDNGKPLTFSRGFDIPASAETFRYYGGWVTKIYGETNPSDPAFFNYTLREPVGVCGQIIPWNFPLLMAAWKLGPALACGNTVILKPAE